jgi:hypothetical protein
MDFKNNILDTKLYDNSLKYINLLITCSEQFKHCCLTCNLNSDDNKDFKAKYSNINFKLNNYHKWLKNIIQLNNDKLFNSNNDIQLNIKSKSLLKKIIEINNTSYLKDIDELKKDINTIESVNSTQFVAKKEAKNKSFLTQKYESEHSKYKTIDLYNLQRINGIGLVSAQKFLDKDIKLENFLEEWDKLFKTDNHQLMPDEYLNLKPNSNLIKLSKEKQIFLKQKFANTRYLKELHFSQLIGIKYFHDIEKKIPRTEIEKMEKIIKTLTKKMNKDIKLDICGSYRRGKKTSGDIDILLSHPDIKEKEDITNMNQNVLLNLIMCLQNIGFLHDHITFEGNTKYMGICKLNDIKYPYRRIDIRFISYNSYASALLYFTGSAELNKKMRIKAISKDYKLNEYGLYKLEFDKTIGKTITGEKFNTIDEKTIFELLDLKYLLPIERNI